MDSELDSSADELPGLEGGTPVGERLRTARQEQRIELEHIAAETRIPVRHLEAIEAGQFDALPSRTYAIGFARNFAKSVGLNEVEVTDAVREELANSEARESALAGGMEPGDSAKLPSAGLAWFGAFAAIVLVIGVIAFTSTYYGAGDGPGSLLAGADGAPEGQSDSGESQAVGQNAGEASAMVNVSDSGQVVFTALEDGIWVRFYEADGERLFEAQMSSGDVFELPRDAAEPRINTGRPDALAITIGGQSVPKLADEPITLGDTPISAAALLARADTPGSVAPAVN